MPIIAIILIVVAGVAGFWFFGNKSVTAPASQQSTEVNVEQPELVGVQAEGTTDETGSVYQNGTYSSSGTYQSPAGVEEIDISLTLEGDTVVGATFVGHAVNPGSVMNQDRFSKGYTDLVVGKNIDEISLTVVNGSSLTPAGFMDALVKIKTNARI